MTQVPSGAGADPGVPHLEPCPFCGGQAAIIEVTEPSNVGGYVVQCNNCEASTRVWFPIKDDVTGILHDAWNKRTQAAAARRAGSLETMQVDPCGCRHTVEVLHRSALCDTHLAAARLAGSPEESTVLTSGVTTFTRASGDMTSLPPHAGTLTQEQYPTKTEVAPGDGRAAKLDTAAIWKLLNEADDHKFAWSTDAWRQWFVQIVDAVSAEDVRCERAFEQATEAGDGRAARLQAIIASMRSAAERWDYNQHDEQDVRHWADQLAELTLAGQPEGK